ncbi:MAG: FliM/FliN family flagellar motor switch protein [Candidatus Baltobacteraceae bacterium]|jgi:hypothetical protein
MIAALAFGPPLALADGRSLRQARFACRSTLPLSAACLVANGVREQLGRLLAAELEVELLEPAIPGPGERRVLLENAFVRRVRGRLCDGFVIVRPADARRLAALAFKEPQRPESASLSEIEQATLERIVGALVPLCASLCGTLGPVTRESSERAACDLTTYFEVRTTGAQRAAIGFALTCDPLEQVGERLGLEDLADVELEGAVEFACGTLGVRGFSRLAEGSTLKLETPLGAAGLLRFGEVVFGRGACGLRDGRSALVFEADGGKPAA